MSNPAQPNLVEVAQLVMIVGFLVGGTRIAWRTASAPLFKRASKDSTQDSD